jgi:cytosine/adenosine deaminase-related metal-dependent hydrolase
VESAQGPLADLLARLGVWDKSIAGTGTHPVDLLADVLARRPIIAAHLNYVEERHLEMLSRFGTTVAYCPRASAYFGHPRDGRPPHRYQEMMIRGINVALGTDSIVCLDTADRLSVLDDMRFLYRRDGVEPRTLVRMATVNGALALGFDPQLFSCSPGPSAGLLAIPLAPTCADPLAAILESSAAPEWISGPFTPNNPSFP